MKVKELRKKSVEERADDLMAFKKELFNLRFQSVHSKVVKTHRVRQLKRAVARVKTLLNESARELNKADKKDA
jgi:large subunit ribosomal protein L29